MVSRTWTQHARLYLTCRYLPHLQDRAQLGIVVPNVSSNTLSVPLARVSTGANAAACILAGVPLRGNQPEEEYVALYIYLLTERRFIATFTSSYHDKPVSSIDNETSHGSCSKLF